MADKELLAYFASGVAVSCGRFDNTQLDRTIQYVEKNNFIPSSFKKIAAAVATAVSLSKADAQVPFIDRENAEIFQCNTNVVKDTALASEVKISGEVRNGNGEPVKNATISSPVMQDVYTDDNGRFSFVLKKEETVPQNFVFSYDNMVTLVRSYHPAMGNTSYSITLYKLEEHDYTGGITMGGIRSDIGLPDLSSLYFKRKETSLLNGMKQSLASLASAMKNNPFASIVIIAYPTTTISSQAVADKRQNAIVNYLVNKLGISNDRIFTNKIIKGGDVNIIDIKQE